MSWQATTWAVTQDVQSSPAKFILMLLANYAGADGYTFVGQATLAEDASMSKRTVVRHMAVLEEQGLITRKRRFREDGTRSSDGVYLNLEKASDQPSADLTSGQKEQGPSDTSGRDQVTESHSNNLLEEQSVKSKTPFEEFWEAYPHPVNRGSRKRAQKKFEKLDAEKVMAALVVYKTYANHPDQKGWYKTKAAEFWLSVDVWEGYLPDAPAAVDMSKIVTRGTPEYDAVMAWKLEDRKRRGLRGDLPRWETMPIPEGYTPPEEQTQ